MSTTFPGSLGWAIQDGGHSEWPPFTTVHRHPKGRFTRYNFVACDIFTTSLRHESFRVNQTYNLLTIVV